MPKMMFDTQIYDLIAETQGLIDALNDLQDQGHLEILSTHIQEDELAGIKDADKAALIALLNRKCVPTAGAVYGLSQYGAATYGDGSSSGISIEQVCSPSGRHIEDALIATSASQHAEVLVTVDGRLSRRLRSVKPRCYVWSFERLKEWVAAQTGV